MSSPYDPRNYRGPTDGPDEQPTYPGYDAPHGRPQYEGRPYEGHPYEGQQPYAQPQDEQGYTYYGDQSYGHSPQPQAYSPYQGQHYSPQVYVQSDGGDNTSLAPVTSLVTGLVGFFVAWIPLVGMVAWVLGPLAIVFGILGLKRGRAEHKIMSMFGLIAGAVSVIVCFGYVLLFMLAASS